MRLQKVLMQLPTINTRFAMMIFLPTRLLTIFTLLTLIPIFHVSWSIATQIFHIFFPVYVASFIIKVILTRGNLKNNFESLGLKYTMSVPVEFAGIASFALLSFSTNPHEAEMMGIYVSAVVVMCSFFVEVYHHYVRPRLAKIRLTDKQAILTIIGFTCFLVYFGIYFINLNPLTNF